MAHRLEVARGRLLAAIAWFGGAAISIHAQVGNAQELNNAFARYARSHAIPVKTVAADNDAGDLRPLATVIGSARVVALGEPAHGVHEALAFRNRLFRYLVEELGFTAIALESGLPESRRILDFVAGGDDDVTAVVRENLSWGFGAFHENEELIRWIREYNADPAHRRKIRVYGIDLSLGGPAASTPTPAAINEVLSYLDRVDTASAGRLRTKLLPYLRRLPDAASASFSPAEHDALSTAVDELTALLERERPAYSAATSAAEWEWARRNAVVAQLANRVFRALPPEAQGGGGSIPPDAWRAVSARDVAMAENLQWVLAEEGPTGRVLVFAHNSHVKNAPTEGGIWSAFSRAPNAMGEYLRLALGDQLLIVGTSSGKNGDGLPPASSVPGSIDAVLAGVGMPLFLLDLRAARGNADVAAWLRTKRPLRANFTTSLTVPLGTAFDVIFYVDTLTPAHTSAPAH